MDSLLHAHNGDNFEVDKPSAKGASKKKRDKQLSKIVHFEDILEWHGVME
ncbi:predicted protein [Sclerotinia sclerotiorum 1980 UF-70]|uniref:Uncharacterized protein n=1 Tax=Sclerotinia sclerotiorum (strain ATCC 18683 / 1980 / Ss-1) TaxID=665079 RepID=A7F6F8_SCLS1|nr:predicted protein [Sclerotinia sclerotiorum 1980 UF-70]EDN98329.1 predicted protein [Sclerotinia sclerotiorum 1980 UF-70]